MSKQIKEFKVVAKSLNTNSFGLHQMIVVAKDGEAYKTHANYLNVKEEGETIHQIKDEKLGTYFSGHEMTEKLEDVPKEALEEIFKD